MRYKTVEDIKKRLKDLEQIEFQRRVSQPWFNAKEYKFRPAVAFKVRSAAFYENNIHFDPIQISATSYRWWEFVKVINGKVVFNDYSYSNTTSKHQSQVSSLMMQLGIKVNYYIDSPRGLQNLSSSIEYYKDKINDLKAQIAKPKTRKSTNEQRKTMIRFYQHKLRIVNKLLKPTNEVTLEHSSQ